MKNLNKCNVICLNCGNVQIRTDIEENINNKYVILKRKIMCPKCSIVTKQAATQNVKTLAKKLNPEANSKDYEILYLIGR